MNSVELRNNTMFSFKNKYTLEKPIHKIDFIKYPSSLATVNNKLQYFSQFTKRRCIHVYRIVS